jgi:hypothetical protein
MHRSIPGVRYGNFEFESIAGYVPDGLSYQAHPKRCLLGDGLGRNKGDPRDGNQGGCHRGRYARGERHLSRIVTKRGGEPAALGAC